LIISNRQLLVERNSDNLTLIINEILDLGRWKNNSILDYSA
jgi:hypothetical protein